jgi:hypothetical protein
MAEVTSSSLVWPLLKTLCLQVKHKEEIKIKNSRGTLVQQHSGGLATTESTFRGEYRGGTYSPSRELVGSVAQISNYKHSLIKKPHLTGDRC